MTQVRQYAMHLLEDRDPLLFRKSLHVLSAGRSMHLLSQVERETVNFL